ncbi:endoribonuclease YbeY [Bacteroidia bacterium]|nr:endoribonuclease YbeY [Bacteroidia bacterium]
MAVHFFSEQTPFCYKGKRQTKAWIRRIISDVYGLQAGDISVIFCNDNYLLQINRQYLQHDYYTDVITFDYSQMPVVSGDVFISIDTVRSNASEYKSLFYNELHRVIIHGILHLCGEKDKTQQQQTQMRTAEDKSLRLLEMNNDKLKFHVE